MNIKLENKKIIIVSFRNVSFATLYIFTISQVMQNGEKLFNENDTLMPFAFLLLFSLSAAVVGGLMFGSAIFLFFEGKKKESFLSAVYSIGWLGFFTFISLALLFILGKL